MSPISVRSIGHCNVNCRDLERSRRFYTELLDLAAETHTNPVPQDGTGFGMDGPVQWDAWILHDHRGSFAGPAIDLLEWTTPVPAGDPYPTPNNLGFARLAVHVPDIDAMYERLVAAGALLHDGVQDIGSLRMLVTHDPDGVQLACFQGRVSAPEFRGVAINCSDLGRTRDWYLGNFGFETVGQPSSASRDGRFMGHDGPYEVENQLLALPGGARVFTLGLEHWKSPQSVGRPYPVANHVGIFRMAFMVDDAHACHDQLLANGVDLLSPPVWLDMGPEVPIDGLWALFFRDPDGTCVELIQAPVVSSDA